MMSSFRFTRVAALAVAALIAVAAAPLSAAAATSSPAKVSAVANLPHSNYRSPVMYLAPTGTAGAVTPQVTGNGSTIGGSHSKTICPQSCGSLGQSFHTSYKFTRGFFTSCFHSIDGWGFASWGGAKPYNANVMTLNNNLWVAGIGVSISVGASLGASVSVSNNTIYFSESHTNTWSLSHSFSNAQFCTSLGMTGPYENSRDSAKFGSHTYTDFIN
jgi:hypothetical protein